VQSDLSIRGGGFEQVVVLVDGVRMSDPQTGHFDLNLALPLDQVERVEILRGPASALYGADAMGGVVNLVTRDGGQGWYGRIEGGSWETGRVSAGGTLIGGDASMVQVGGELSRSDGHRTGTDFDATLLNLTFRRLLGPGRLSGAAGLARQNFGAADFYAPYPSFEKTRTYTSSLRFEAGEAGGTSLELGSSFRRHEDEFTLIRDDPGVYQNRHTSSQVGGEALVRHSSPRGVNLAFGGQVYQDILRSNSLGDREENRGAVFAEAVIGGRGSGVISLGLRHDFHEGFGSFFSPSLSASHRFAPNLRARAAVGRSFRAPTWTERYYQDPVNVGREDLDAERAWSGEVGVDLAASSTFWVSVTGFIRQARDLIDWARALDAPEDAPWETRNVEKADFQGVEADLHLLGPLQTRWTMGMTFLDVESKEVLGFTSKYALRPLEEQVKLGVDRTFRGRLALGLKFQRGRRPGEDSYHRLDMRGALDLGSTRIYLDLTNALAEDYPDITGASAPGRAFFVGFEVKGPARF
jgi:iron complex outermembrane receptor protein